MFISFVRTIILYFTIILAVRVMGKRQINQLQTSELVVTLLISDLAVIPMQDSGQPLFSGLIPILVLIALEVLVSVLCLKAAVFTVWCAASRSSSSKMGVSFRKTCRSCA